MFRSPSDDCRCFCICCHFWTLRHRDKYDHNFRKSRLDATKRGFGRDALDEGVGDLEDALDEAFGDLEDALDKVFGDVEERSLRECSLLSEALDKDLGALNERCLSSDNSDVGL